MIEQPLKGVGHIKVLFLHLFNLVKVNDFGPPTSESRQAVYRNLNRIIGGSNVLKLRARYLLVEAAEVLPLQAREGPHCLE